MKEARRYRLQNEAGESIAEVLVALLISALGLMLLASMITSASNLVRSSEKSIQGYVEGGNGLAAGSDGVTGVTVVSGTVEWGIALTDSSGTSTTVDYYVQEAFGGKSVATYRKRVDTGS